MPLDRVEPNAQGRIERTRLVMQVPTQALWKRQYPLAQRYRRQHMIREVGRGHGHAARVAGRADAATIAQDAIRKSWPASTRRWSAPIRRSTSAIGEPTGLVEEYPVYTCV